MERGLKYVSEAGNTGYGRAARGYLRALSRTGIPLTWTPMVVGNRWNMYLQPFVGPSIDDELGHLCNRSTVYGPVLVHLISPYFDRWRQREPGRTLIGVTVWETDRLPGHRELQCLDGLIVPCRWNAQVFRDGGVTCPIHVAPHLHIESAEEVVAADIPAAAKEDFVFYSIGDWKDRKGMHLTVEAFCRAFTGRDPVVLAIKTGRINERRNNPRSWRSFAPSLMETSEQEIARIRRGHRDPPRVVALTSAYSDAEMQSLHKRADCYVSLPHAEGWGLGAYEAAFAGNPVIITGYGGQLDYLPSRLSRHVDYRLVPANPQGAIDHAYQGHRWAEPDLDHAAALMRATVDRPEDARRQGKRLQCYVRETFAAEPIARGMIEFARSLG